MQMEGKNGGGLGMRPIDKKMCTTHQRTIRLHDEDTFTGSHDPDRVPDTDQGKIFKSVNFI